MNRLLFAPLLIALAGCSNDLIVKTDQGERYIVKDSAVKITNWTKSDAIKGIQKDHPIDRCRKMRSKENCISDHLWSDKVTQHLEYEKLIIDSDIQIPYKLIRFRPIFIDANKDKSANNYMEVSCFNYSATLNLKSFYRTKYLTAISRASKDISKNIPDTSSSLAIDKVKNDVCSKYAKFDSSEEEQHQTNKDELKIIKRRAYIGINYLIKKNNFIVDSVNEETPAWENGIRKGDKIISINGESLRGKTIEESQQMFAQSNEAIEVTINKNGKMRTVTLRKVIRY